MTVPKVSIVIPAFNEERLIRHTLAAACAQAYPDFEVIVVDNNSTDRTVDAVREFPSVRLVHELEQGILTARECGRVHAAGDIIANLDADCIPPADWLARAVGHFDDPRVVAVSGPYDFYDGSWYFRSVARTLQQGVFPIISGVNSFLFNKGAIPMGGNMFIRAEALQRVGGYNTGIKFYGEDVDTTRRLSGVGRVLYATDIAVRSSARRFQRLGILTTEGKYILNYLWVTVFKKPFHNTPVD